MTATNSADGNAPASVSNVAAWNPTNHQDTEQRLRRLLRGRRLVGELDLTPEGDIFRMARWVFIGTTKMGDYSRLRHYPAVTATFLVGEGGRCYDDGTFWPNIESLEGASPRVISIVGEAFEAAVLKLGLEDFNEAPEAGRWLRFVTPILLHGGIPASCAPDAAELVLSSLRNGAQDATDLIDSVLRSSIRSAQVARPLQRFFAYGGEFALDLVQRMITAILDAEAVGRSIASASVTEMAEDLGLPTYLMQALLDGGSLGKAARGRRSLRPQVQVDRYSCNGPHLVLPPVASGGEWLLTGSSASRYKALKRDAREVPLAPARGWSVALRSSTIDARSRFDGHPDVAAYVFDAEGRLARQQRRVRDSQALILAASDIKITCEDGTPIPLVEELPARSHPWHGWKLWHVHASGLSAISLRNPHGLTGPSEINLPVSRPIPGPAIKSSPVGGVTGPSGCAVYSEAPAVAEPEVTPASAWRVRWRSDNESSPPPTAILGNMPRCSQGRDLSPRLPDTDAFCGTIEVVGPLGSDLRERVTVVRGLHVDLPDRIVGPNDTEQATLSANCLLTCSDGSSGHEVTAAFAPGRDSTEILARDVKLTVKIPRLSWAVGRRGGSLPVFDGTCQRIGVDEVESGEAESLIVRCGRPARVALHLEGTGVMQEAGPVQADGLHGRWAFPLSQFRDTISASGLARLSLAVDADGIRAQAAVIEARYEVSDLVVEVIADAEAGQALAEVRWTENRRFSGRELRLWSLHRPWTPPVCHDMPNDIDGHFDCVVDTPPGPYLAQVALRDDWTTPQRPCSDDTGTSLIRVGSARDARARITALRPDVAVEALELAVAGDRRATQVDSRCVAEARSELLRAIAVTCRSKSDVATLSSLLHLGEAVDGLVARMLAEDLAWSLPPDALLRLTLALVPAASRHAADAETLEVLWEAVPVAAAVLDSVLDDDGEARWKRFAGWIPTPGADGPEQPPQPVSPPLDDLEPPRLDALSDALPTMDSLPLQFGGYTIAALEMLKRSWPDRAALNDWMAAHTRVTTYRQRLSEIQLQQIKALSPAAGAPGWHKFPERLLVAAFKVIDEFGSEADKANASRAVVDAAEIAPLLTTRSLLTAAATLHAATRR